MVPPPSRSLASEVAIAALIFIGASSASMLVSLCLSFFVSAVPAWLIPGNDEGGVFGAGILYTAVSNCIGLLLSPVIFVSVAANHCRRVTTYFFVFTPTIWLLQLGFLWRQHFLLRGEPFVAFASTAIGLGLGYWILRRKERHFGNAFPSVAGH